MNDMNLNESQRVRTNEAVAGQAELCVIRWMPIETALKDGTIVDLWRHGERITDYRWVQLSKDNGFFEGVNGGYTCVRDAEFWMHVPESPYNAAYQRTRHKTKP